MKPRLLNESVGFILGPSALGRSGSTITADTIVLMEVRYGITPVH